MKIVKFLVISILTFIASASCSGGNKTPVSNNAVVPGATNSLSTQVNDTPNRDVLAVYDAVIYPIAKTFTVTPSSERMSDYHLPLTKYYPNTLQVTRYGFTPSFWADIKITHPLPLSGIDGFDPRVIAIIPANPGVSMSYPTFDVLANDSVVLNPDGYTKLFDSLGGAIPGNTNPFLAYFKQVEYRHWFSSGTGMTSDTRRWQMDINGFGGPMIFKLVVDVSSNYPNPPMQVVDNAPEPVEMNANIGTGLIQSGGSATIEVTLLDWQGTNGIGGVKVESPELFNGTVDLNYKEPGQNPNEYIYTGTIPNELFPPAGEQPVLIAAWDIPSDIHIFNETAAIVSNDINFNPVDITPPWLNFSPSDVFIDGNYAYVAGGYNGLHIFDISDPLNPVWVNWVDTPDFAHDVYVSGGYAYVADNSSGLQIIDIEPPESASIVKTVDTPDWTNGVYVTGNYAYVTDYSGLNIIDIDPPESASIVKTVDTVDWTTGVYVNGSYAYVTDYSGLSVIDIDPPESASIMKTVDTSDWANGVYVTGGYAYVTDYSGLNIIDIEPPESASIVKTVDTPDGASDVYVTGDYAYVANGYSGLQITDIMPPESAYIVKTVDTPGGASDVNVTGDYAYVANGYSGLQITDIMPPESAFIVKTVGTPGGASDVYVTDGYAYVADPTSGLQIIDIEPPESASIVKTVDTPGWAYGVYVTGAYAYVADYESGLHIIDIEPPESAYIMKTVDTTGYAMDVYVTGGYAYVADYGSGLRIIKLW